MPLARIDIFHKIWRDENSLNRTIVKTGCCSLPSFFFCFNSCYFFLCSFFFFSENITSAFVSLSFSIVSFSHSYYKRFKKGYENYIITVEYCSSRRQRRRDLYYIAYERVRNALNLLSPPSTFFQLSQVKFKRVREMCGKCKKKIDCFVLSQY